MRVPFLKYHGLGNDFVVLDARDGDLVFTGPLAERLCARHTGIGADGLLVFTGTVQAPRMQVVNADGSVPEMCGNGLRCFVKYLFDHHDPGGSEVTVQTGAGPLRCQVERGPDGRVGLVQAAMGRPTFAPAQVPIAAAGPLVDTPVEVGGRTLRLTAVGTGNPHAVSFEPLDEAERLRLGPLVGSLPLFPRGANVEFVQLLSEVGSGTAPRDPAQPPRPRPGTPRMRVDVYERGCGWTQACGTGATAAVFAAVQLGLAPVDREVAVRLPGGWLGVRIDRDGTASMRGPAVEVFAGTVDLASLAEASSRTRPSAEHPTVLDAAGLAGRRSAARETRVEADAAPALHAGAGRATPSDGKPR